MRNCIIVVVLLFASLSACNKTSSPTLSQQFDQNPPALISSEDSASYFYGLANGDGFMRGLILGNMGYLTHVDVDTFLVGLDETLSLDSVTVYQRLQPLTNNIDMLNLPQSQLSYRYGILAGLSSLSFTRYYDINWNHSLITQGYYHSMVHDHLAFLPGRLAEESLREILHRLTPATQQ